jgi:hypothetical protein
MLGHIDVKTRTCIMRAVAVRGTVITAALLFALAATWLLPFWLFGIR